MADTIPASQDSQDRWCLMGLMKRQAESRLFSPSHQANSPQPETRKMATTLVNLATGTTSAQRKSARVKAPPLKAPPCEQLTMWEM
jgi:hypothetical protein